MQGNGSRTTALDHAESHLDEDAALLEARARGADFGCVPVTPHTGATLRFLATALRARAVVEVGTGTGVSGLWLLRGMAPDGVLTSIDVEPELQRAARAAFLADGFPPGRLRLINGMALDVLPRLADGAYDLVFVDAVTAEYPRYLDEAIRLLRPGGVVAMPGAATTAETEPAAHDPFRHALREVRRICQEHDQLVSLLLPVDEGLLLAAKAL